MFEPLKAILVQHSLQFTRFFIRKWKLTTCVQTHISISRWVLIKKNLLSVKQKFQNFFYWIHIIVGFWETIYRQKCFPGKSKTAYSADSAVSYYSHPQPSLQQHNIWIVVEFYLIKLLYFGILISTRHHFHSTPTAQCGIFIEKCSQFLLQWHSK